MVDERERLFLSCAYSSVLSSAVIFLLVMTCFPSTSPSTPALTIDRVDNSRSTDDQGGDSSTTTSSTSVVHAEACFGYYDRAWRNYFYLSTNDGNGFQRFDVAASIGTCNTITDVTFWIRETYNNSGDGYVSMYNVNAFTGLGGASELGPQPTWGSYIGQFAQVPDDVGWRSFTSASFLSQAQSTYSRDGHIYIGEQYESIRNGSWGADTIEYPSTDIPYVVVTYEPGVTTSVILRPNADHGSATNMERYPAPGTPRDLVWSSNLSAEAYFNTDGGGTGHGSSYCSKLNTTYHRLIFFRFDLVTAGLPSTGASILEVNLHFLISKYTSSGSASIHESAAFSGSWYGWASRPTLEGELAYTSIPGSTTVWKNVTDTSGNLLNRTQANYDIDHKMYFVFDDCRISSGDTSYEIGSGGQIANAFLQVRYVASATPNWDSHYFNRVNETTAGGDGMSTYIMNHPAGLQSSMYFDFSDPNWTDYPDIIDIDVTPWAVISSWAPETTTQTREHLWVDGVQQPGWHDGYVGFPFANFSRFYELNPQTSTEWSISSVNGLYCDVGYTPNGEAYWSQVAIKVDITYSLLSKFILDLVPGWNFVSLPLVGYGYKASTLGLNSGDTVTQWNPATKVYQNHIVGVPVNDFNILPSVGYWVNVPSGTRTLTLYGSVPTTTQSRAITVPAGGGWAIIGFESLITTRRAADVPAMYSITGGITVVASYSPATKAYTTWLSIIPNTNNFLLVPGQAYWILCRDSGLLTYNP